MSDVLRQYLPDAAVEACHQLIRKHGVHLRVVDKRNTRHGDYRRMKDGSHRITVNAGENPYRFLITLVHEIAHLLAFEKFGYGIKPHGREWKLTFQHLMLPFIRPEIFPADLLPVLAKHFRNPKASSSTDAALASALMQYDLPNNTTCLEELPKGSVFEIYNGKRFRKGNQRIKRFECVELGSGRMFLFQPTAQVALLKT